MHVNFDDVQACHILNGFGDFINRILENLRDITVVFTDDVQIQGYLFFADFCADSLCDIFVVGNLFSDITDQAAAHGQNTRDFLRDQACDLLNDFIVIGQ